MINTAITNATSSSTQAATSTSGAEVNDEFQQLLDTETQNQTQLPQDIQVTVVAIQKRVIMTQAEADQSADQLSAFTEDLSKTITNSDGLSEEAEQALLQLEEAIIALFRLIADYASGSAIEGLKKQAENAPTLGVAEQIESGLDELSEQPQLPLAGLSESDPAAQSLAATSNDVKSQIQQVMVAVRVSVRVRTRNGQAEAAVADAGPVA